MGFTVFCVMITKWIFGFLSKFILGRNVIEKIQSERGVFTATLVPNPDEEIFQEPFLPWSEEHINQWKEEGKFIPENIRTVHWNARHRRALRQRKMWHAEDTDGKIAIPFSFHRSFPENDQEKVIKAMKRLNDDLGCLKTIYVPKEDLLDATRNPWKNGIFFVWGSIGWSSCWSYVGLAPGYSGSWITMADHGAPDSWQFIALDKSCHGSRQSTVEHEVLHALGFGHEHQRPDRDKFITVNVEASKYPTNFYKISDWVDQGANYPFEYNSVMTFCSECGAKDRNIPVMTFHNGKTYGDPLRITTTDSIQVILAYCNDRGDYYKKQTKRCLYEDKVVPGFHREVYSDRICDGIPDCPEGEDELGDMGRCIHYTEDTQDGCCTTVLFGDKECRYSVNFNEKPSYVCDENDDFVIFFLEKTWYMGISGLPSDSFSYMYFVESDELCPPMGNWIGEKTSKPGYLYCKSKDVDLVNNCIDNLCSDFARCIDEIDGYICECLEGYSANGSKYESDNHKCKSDLLTTPHSFVSKDPRILDLTEKTISPTSISSTARQTSRKGPIECSGDESFDDMLIKCSLVGMEITVDVCAFKKYHIDYKKARIAKDDNCGPILHNDAIVMYSFSIDECGTRTTNNGSHLIFSNDIIGSIIYENSVISRSREVDIGISCAVKKDQTVSLSYGISTKIKRSSGQSEIIGGTLVPVIATEWIIAKKEGKKSLFIPMSSRYIYHLTY